MYRNKLFFIFIFLLVATPGMASTRYYYANFDSQAFPSTPANATLIINSGSAGNPANASEYTFSRTGYGGTGYCFSNANPYPAQNAIFPYLYPVATWTSTQCYVSYRVRFVNFVGASYSNTKMFYPKWDGTEARLHFCLGQSTPGQYFYTSIYSDHGGSTPIAGGIYINVANLTDGNWHQLAWFWDTATGDVKFWYDRDPLTQGPTWSANYGASAWPLGLDGRSLQLMAFAEDAGDDTDWDYRDLDEWEIWDGMPETTPDTTAPTLSSASVSGSGQEMYLSFDEAVTADSGDIPTLSMSGGAVTMAYSSGSGSSTLVYTLSRTVYNNETGTMSYTQDTDGIEDVAGNDLATLSPAQAVVTTNAPTWTAAGLVNINGTPGAVNSHYNSGNRRIVRIGNTVIALCPESTNQDHTYRSTDDGATWSEIDTDGSYSGCLITGKNNYVYHFYYNASGSVYMVKFLYDASSIASPVAIQGSIGSIGGDKDIAATVDSTGKLYVFYHHGNPDAVYCIASANDGVTWNGPYTVQAAGTYDFYYLRPDVTSGGTVVIAFGENTTGDLYFGTSSDGISWSTSEVFASASLNRYNPDILTVGADTIYIFCQESGTGSTPGVSFMKSVNSGSTWSAWSSIEATTSSNGYGDPSAALGSDGTIYVSYRNDSGSSSGNWKEHVSASSNGGDDWQLVYDYDDATYNVGSRCHMRYQTWWNYGGKLEWTWFQYNAAAEAQHPIFYDSFDEVSIYTMSDDDLPPTAPSLQNVQLINAVVR